MEENCIVVENLSKSVYPIVNLILDLKFTIGYILFIMKNKNLLKTAFIALFAAIVCIGCFLRIPLGPIPIVLQNGKYLAHIIQPFL